MEFKRAKIRRNPPAYVAARSIVVSEEYIIDFCSAFSRLPELSNALRNVILKEPPIPPADTELPTIPLQFPSANAYLETFQSMILEEVQCDFLSLLAQPSNLCHVGFQLLQKISPPSDDLVFKMYAFVPFSPHFTGWKNRESDEAQLGGNLFKEDSTQRRLCGLSQLVRGDVLVLRQGKNLGITVVHRSARPFSNKERDTGIEIELVGLSSIQTKFSTGPVLAYSLVEFNLLGAWREWDGVHALLRDTNRAWKSPLIPALLGLSGSMAHLKEEGKPTMQDVLTLPGISPKLQSLLLNKYNGSQMDAIGAAAAKQTKGFVLVQGPPGTGKTHTLYGMLNALHVSVSQMYYNQVLPDPFCATNPEYDTKQRFDWLRDLSNPHLLVVAPSNAAVDNVLRLVMELGFLDGTGQKYTPTCVRIASANWRKSNTFVFSKCSLDIQVDELMILREESLKDKSITKQMDDLVSRLKGTESEVRLVGKVLTEKANEHAESRQTLHLEEFHALSKQFISFRNRARDIALDLERTRLLHTPSISDNVLRADMRALILTQSNLVFATLNQCGSDSIREIAPTKVRFNVCVVDEAAQCVEPSVCIPLSLGVERCIMVGDPLQLPATVLSDKAGRAQYEQSLFERLQLLGHPVHLLNTQYRCRPELSSFTSRNFYQSKLLDGANVLQASYRLPELEKPFGPLVFFDVGFGIQTKRGTSLCNEEEARSCHHLYKIVRNLRPTSLVAIISPYREQLVCIRHKFGNMVTSPLLEMNTVDGFQGREVDIVIFSCVRSVQAEQEGTGIGFLADRRRLNVAITRARFNLFIVGNYSVLKLSPLWRKLLDHIKSKGKTVRMRNCEDIFSSE